MPSAPKKKGMVWQAALGLVTALVVLSLFVAAKQLHGRGASGHSHRGGRIAAKSGASLRRSSSRALPRGPVGSPVHIAFCTDDTDLRALLVAIKTACATAADPRRFVFHVVTSAELAPLFDTLLRLHVREGAAIEIHHDIDLRAKITAMMPLKAAGPVAARQGLANPFNFAPFFLSEYLAAGEDGLKAEKVLVLDTDVVVRGDLAEVYDVDLKGEVVAAVKDCLTRYEDVFNLPELAKVGFPDIDPRACVLQRGVHLLNLPLWRDRGLTGQIEEWMIRYRDAEDALWRDGFAQPPWLLVVNGSYQEIEPEWNCFNLGKPTMSFEEASVVRRIGFDHKSLLYDLYIAISKKYGTMKPFLATCTMTAKLLHFSGELKPWLADVWVARTPAPVCFVPLDLHIPNQTTSDFHTMIIDQPQRLVRCMELWLMHLSSEEDCALKDLEKEWIEDEQYWHDEFKKELKRKKEAAETKKREEEERKKKGDEEAEKNKDAAKEKEAAKKEEEEKKDAEAEDKDSIDGVSEEDDNEEAGEDGPEDGASLAATEGDKVDEGA